MKNVLGITTLALLMSSGAHAQELTGVLKKIKDTNEISVGYREASVPFSYLDNNQKPIGYSMDICEKIIDVVKETIQVKDINIKTVPITSSTRIPLMTNGTIDIECGSTTNNAERQKQVWFTNAHYVTAAKYATKISDGINSIDDLKGKSVSSVAGSSNMVQLQEINAARNLGITIIPVKEATDGFMMLETGRVSAFFNDDVILAPVIALARDPKAYKISEDSTSLPAPYGIMIPKDDKPFKAIADKVTSDLYTSEEFAALYAKWFQQPIPPRGTNLNLPMSAVNKGAFSKPTDSPDPKDYANR